VEGISLIKVVPAAYTRQCRNGWLNKASSPPHLILHARSDAEETPFRADTEKTLGRGLRWRGGCFAKLGLVEVLAHLVQVLLVMCEIDILRRPPIFVLSCGQFRARWFENGRVRGESRARRIIRGRREGPCMRGAACRGRLGTGRISFIGAILRVSRGRDAMFTRLGFQLLI